MCKRILRIFLIVVIFLPATALGEDSTSVVLQPTNTNAWVHNNTYEDDWSLVRLASSGNRADNIDEAYVGAVGFENSNNGRYVIDRTFLTYDTSVLPAGASIVSAKLKVTPAYKYGTPFDAYSYIGLVGPAYPESHDAVSVNDYSAIDVSTQPDLISNYTHAGTEPWQPDSQIEFVLNANGLAAIDYEGYTSMALLQGHDIENVAPPLELDNFYYAIDYTLGNRPVLEITYNVDESATGNSNIAFLPGITGSRLYSLQEGEKLWEPGYWSDIYALRHDKDGGSLDPSIYTTEIIDILPWYFGPFTKREQYVDFIDFMDGLVDEGTIEEWKALAYDWRLSLRDLVEQGTVIDSEDGKDHVSYLDPTDEEPYLIRELERLADAAPNGKVSIIAHSNGGLLAKYLLKHLEDTEHPLLTKIDKVVLAATPQLGTPKTIGELLHGTLPAARGTSREATENMPGTYHLLPSEKYFNTTDRPVLVFDDSVASIPLMAGLAGEEYRSYSSMIDFVSGNGSAWNEPGALETSDPNVLNPTLLSYAETVHALLDDWTPPEQVEVVELVGDGLSTIYGAEYHYCESCTLPDTTLKGLRHIALRESLGDGTVMTESARGGEGMDTYYVSLVGYNRATGENIEHGTFMSTGAVAKYIEENVIGSSEELPEYIGTEGVNIDDLLLRIEGRVYSPLNVHLYHDGKHTGLLSEGEEGKVSREYEAEIPNSYYDEWGEVKYFGAELDLIDEVVLEGTGAGTFTLEIDIKEGSTVLHEVRYRDVPVTGSMQGELIMPEGDDLGELRLDYDGDGEVDAVVQPEGEQEEEPQQPTIPELFALLRETVRTAEMHSVLKAWILLRVNLAEQMYERGVSKGRDAFFKKASQTLDTVERTIDHREGQWIESGEAAEIHKRLDVLQSALEK